MMRQRLVKAPRARQHALVRRPDQFNLEAVLRSDGNESVTTPVWQVPPQ